ncbi:MAG: ParB N-terminal domain-containing protein [Firmicutes bacterium]|nr:ParB N-terminal domain-containing protein [Bacillota bacterium]
MAESKITIKGIPQKKPQIVAKEGVILIFKIIPGKTQISGMPAYESYCRVSINKNLWKKVSKEIKETTYYILEGVPKANVNPKGMPFISVLCSDIKVVNGLVEDEKNPGSFKFPGSLPEDTDEVIPISSIRIPENLKEPKTAKKKALDYFKKHGTFKSPVVVKKDTMTLVSGYANYLIAKDLNIEMVPVSYNLLTGAKSKDEIKIKNIKWYMLEEVTEINVKDIILTEDIHLNVQNFIFSINLKEIAKTMEITTPIAVRPLEGGKYSLVIGAARYFAAKILDIEKIPAVITDMSHDEFMGARLLRYHKVGGNNKARAPKGIEGETPISLIKVPESFLKTKPNPAKVKETIEYYRKHGKFDKPVVIRGDNNLLVDGYKRYIAAKEMNLTSVWTVKLK